VTVIIRSVKSSVDICNISRSAKLRRTMAKRPMDTSNESYSAFRDFLLDHADLLRDVLSQSHKEETLTVSDEANLVGSSVSALCDHCITVFERLTMKSSIRAEVLSFLRNVNKFKTMVSQYVQSVHDQAANTLVIELVVDASCRVQGTVLSTNGSVTTIPPLDSYLCRFHVVIDCTTFAGDYRVNILGSFLNYCIDETLNKRLKAQYEMNFLNHKQGLDYMNLSTDRKANDHMQKRVAVYDAGKYRTSQYTYVKRTSKKEDTKKILFNALRTNVLFSSYTDYEQKRIVDAFEKVDIVAGETVIRQGERGDHFYVVESGRLQLYIENSDGEQILSSHNIDAGSSFGEIALLYDIPRTATVAAVENSVLWRVDRHTYRYVVSSSEKQSMEENMSFLSEVQVRGKKFKDMLHGNDLNLLVTAVEQEEYPPGDIIIRQDQPGDYFYIIKSGDVGVCKVEKTPGCDSPVQKALMLSGSTDSVEGMTGAADSACSSTVGGNEFSANSFGLGPQIAVLHAGDYFGERALLGEDVRQASCVALSKVTCLSLSREMFVKLVGCWQDLELDAAPSAPSAMFRRVLDADDQNTDGAAVSNDFTYAPMPVNGEACLGMPLPPSHSTNTATLSAPTTPIRGTVSSGANSKPSSGNLDNEAPSALYSFVFHTNNANNVSTTNANRGRTVSGTSDENEHRSYNEGITAMNDMEQLFTLGTGAFGRVRLARSKQGKYVVIKIQGKKVCRSLLCNLSIMWWIF
jgi:cAMP-dependent protein kinase regulator